MNDPLHPLLEALAQAPEPVDFFLRDDDAGWADMRLMALLDCTARAGVPIDLAVIPEATGPALAATLCARIDAAPGLLGVHQHGYAHLNHEPTGRKCEFGDSRGAEAQARDLRAGQAWLRECFGKRLDPVFTPPWNRCSALTPALLGCLGFGALSRSRGAPAQHDLPELPVDVDWCKERRLAAERGDDGLGRIAMDLALRVQAGGPVGLMLHHAEMSALDLCLLEVLLSATTGHASLRWRPMAALLPVAVGATS